MNSFWPLAATLVAALSLTMSAFAQTSAPTIISLFSFPLQCV
ncbi:MAG: hypothetical protein WB762_35460 [Candidatus Sulfotelmatobacter sp.]